MELKHPSQPRGSMQRKAEQQERGAQVPDDHGAAATPAMACLPMESYAELRFY